jgi:predicted nuclease of predicted toxin-antitoxin system
LRLLLDEMYAHAVADGLRALGHDVVSVHDRRETPLAGASDPDVLAAARREKRALVTENVRDFRPLESALLADGSHHAGLVYTSDRQFPRGDPATTGQLVHALDAFLRTTPTLRDRAVFLARVDPGPDVTVVTSSTPRPD